MQNLFRMSSSSVLLIEAFYGGSHKQLIDLIEKKVAGCVKYTLPAKKWHWRARTSALYFSEIIPHSSDYRVLFTSAVLNLAELAALRPDLSPLKKILYFHENQLIYPVRKQQDRDFQYGYNQILSSLVTDEVVFNSQFNMDSYLSAIKGFLKLIPDHRPKDIAEKIRPKCRVLHFPIQFPNCADGDLHGITTSAKVELSHRNECNDTNMSLGAKSQHKELDSVYDVKTKSQHKELDSVYDVKTKSSANRTQDACSSEITCVGDSSCNDKNISSEKHKLNLGHQQQHPVVHNKEVTEVNLSGNILEDASRKQGKPLHIVWPHRWEHDKDPDLFFKTLFRLHDEGHQFHLSVLGETYTDVPSIFEEAQKYLHSHIIDWGYKETKAIYFRVLQKADVVVSTAKHEFFGVAMLEAVHFQCYPLCPNQLVYPELFPAEYLYNTPQQLYKRLRAFCQRPHLSRHHINQVDITRYSWEVLGKEYENLLISDALT